LRALLSEMIPPLFILYILRSFFGLRLFCLSGLFLFFILYILRSFFSLRLFCLR